MKPSAALAIHRDAIRRVVQSHRARNPRVFGSVLHGDDTDDSDLDILVEPTAETSLLDLGAIYYELNALLGVPVDVVTPNALPKRSRDQVLSERGTVDMSRDERRLRDYFAHIVQAIAKIQRYTEDVDESTFLASELIQDAVIRNFEIIGVTRRELLCGNILISPLTIGFCQ